MGNRRIWWGFGVMLVGACAAWPFRRSWLPEDCAPEVVPVAAAWPLAAHPANPTKLTQSPGREPSPAAVDVAASGDLEPLISARERVATRALAKLEVSARLPSLAANYSPQVEFHPADPRSALLEPPDSSPAIVEWPDPSRQPRRYRIGKHDTLEAIAERLLGSRQHADKLLAANPGVILVPEILPVGATIVIPDIDQATETLVRVPQPRD